MTNKDVKTEGGPFIEGDVNTGRDFAGRDIDNSRTTINGNTLIAVIALLIIGIISVLLILRFDNQRPAPDPTEGAAKANTPMPTYSTPVPTMTIEDKSALSPTFTPTFAQPAHTQQPTNIQVPTVALMITATQDVNIRLGPGTEYELITGIVSGKSTTLLGKNPEGNWLQILLSTGEIGWVFAELVNIPPGEIPVITVIPPAPTATNTSVPIATFTPTPEPKVGDTWLNPIDEALYNWVPPGRKSGIGFWVKQTEVTIKEYNRCVEVGACTPPCYVSGASPCGWYETDEQELLNRWNSENYREFPVAGVTWFQANEYAAWVKGRLPKTFEWEQAACGDDGRSYSWGNELPNSSVVNLDEQYTASRAYPPGAHGLYGTSGSLFEWVVTDDNGADLRGGSYEFNSIEWLQCTARNYFNHDYAYLDVGFRVFVEQANP